MFLHMHKLEPEKGKNYNPILQSCRPNSCMQRISIEFLIECRFEGYLQYIEHPDNPGSKFGFLGIRLNKVGSMPDGGYYLDSDVATITYGGKSPAIELVLPNGRLYQGNYRGEEQSLNFLNYISCDNIYTADIETEKEPIPLVILKLRKFEIFDDL